MKHNYSLIPFHNPFHISKHTNPNSIREEALSSHQTVYLSETSGNGPLYTFELCTFTSLSNSGNGGAITCSASSNSYWKPQLIIKQCSFNSCKSSSGYGGGVYAGGLSSFLVEKTSFTNCNSTTQNGGGLAFSSSTCLPLLSDTTFISCYARNFYSSADYADDGGGVNIGCSYPSKQLHYIIQECRFISCGCYNWGAGGSIGFSYTLVGCTDCIFSACKSGTAEGLGIDLGTTDADCLIHFCYFSCSTSSTPPSDISINRNDGSFSTPFLHSFSTKPITKSVWTLVKWSDNGYPNWHPHAFN